MSVHICKDWNSMSLFVNQAVAKVVDTCNNEKFEQGFGLLFLWNIFYKMWQASACAMYSTNLVPSRVVCRVFLQKFRAVIKLPFPIFQHLQRPLHTQVCFLAAQINCLLGMLILLPGGIQLSRHWSSLSYMTLENCFPTTPKNYQNYFYFYLFLDKQHHQLGASDKWKGKSTSTNASAYSSSIDHQLLGQQLDWPSFTRDDNDTLMDRPTVASSPQW